MDDLTYHYDVNNNNNQLLRVTDAVPASNYSIDIDNQTDIINYEYDKIGNLKKDLAEKLTDIKWTVYGKIESIVKDGKTIYYTYDASGSRITKKTDTKLTVYVRDASGNVMSVYEKPTEDALVQTEINLYGSSRLGVLGKETKAPEPVSTASGYGDAKLSTFTRGERTFELSNHLGNVLATITDQKIQQTSNNTTVSYYTATVTTANDYYPFGMMMPGRRGYMLDQASGGGWSNGGSIRQNWIVDDRSEDGKPAEYKASIEIEFVDGFESDAGDEFVAYITEGGSGDGGNGTVDGKGVYRYGFNGKEMDDEVKGEGVQYDYGFRIYDARLGKFLSVDPLTKSYPMLTPYQFASNTPINSIDLDGLESILSIYGTHDLKNHDEPTQIASARQIIRDLTINHIRNKLLLPNDFNTPIPYRSSYVGTLSAAQRVDVINETIAEFTIYSETVLTGLMYGTNPPKGSAGTYEMVTNFNYAALIDNSDPAKYEQGISELMDMMNEAALAYETLEDVFEAETVQGILGKNLDKGGTAFQAIYTVYKGNYEEAIRDKVAELAVDGVAALAKTAAEKGLLGASLVRSASVVGKSAGSLVSLLLTPGNLSDGQTEQQRQNEQKLKLRNQVISALLMLFMKNNQIEIKPLIEPLPRARAESTGRGVQGDF